MINKPGTYTSTSRISLHLQTSSTSLDWGKNVAPICWVIPPASPSWTLVLLILSNNVVFPVSTCPKIQQTGLLYLPWICWKSALSSFNNFSSFFLNFYFFSSYFLISYWVFYFSGSLISSILPSFTSSACYFALFNCYNWNFARSIFYCCFFVKYKPDFFNFRILSCSSLAIRSFYYCYFLFLSYSSFLILYYSASLSFRFLYCSS